MDRPFVPFTLLWTRRNIRSTDGAALLRLYDCTKEPSLYTPSSEKLFQSNWSSKQRYLSTTPPPQLFHNNRPFYPPLSRFNLSGFHTIAHFPVFVRCNIKSTRAL
jgi:hypothetical protein